MLDHETLKKLGWSDDLVRAFQAAGRDAPAVVDVTMTDSISSWPATDEVVVSDKLLVAEFPPVGNNILRLR